MSLPRSNQMCEPVPNHRPSVATTKSLIYYDNPTICCPAIGADGRPATRAFFSNISEGYATNKTGLKFCADTQSSGCLPIIVVISLTIIAPTLMLWIATWLFGLGDIQQVAASIIIVGSEFAFLFVINLIIMANPTDEDDADEVQPPPARPPERRPRRRSS